MFALWAVFIDVSARRLHLADPLEGIVERLPGGQTEVLGIERAEVGIAEITEHDVLPVNAVVRVLLFGSFEFSLADNENSFGAAIKQGREKKSWTGRRKIGEDPK